MIKWIFKCLMMLCLGFLSINAFSADNNITSDGIGISGYDAVSFFNYKPVKGNKIHTFEHQGVKYLFHSKENLIKFKEAPSLYIPQYGGYCSYGVSLGKKLSIDPLAYEVIQDKLYLLLNGATKKIWDKNKTSNILAADKNWLLISN